MKRLMMIAVVAALALPVLALGAMVGDAERRIARADVMRVAIRGYDPRDLLRGHYLRYRFDWNAETPFIGRVTRLCVSQAPANAPATVRALAANGEHSSTSDCLFVLDGWGETLAEARRAAPGERGPAGRMEFTPSGVQGGRLYVPEQHAAQLERLLIEGKVQLTIDLAVTRDGRARIKAWHIDGKTVDRYFAK
ncbi:MAG TPA: GDYXXLXY domain-containing protein [Vineibacter sp.]|nr:GDYXXLXY domain-containing protein [Vineibacter sp.]